MNLAIFAMQREFAENVQKINTRGAQRGEVRKSVRLRICAEIRRETPPKTMTFAYVRAFSRILGMFCTLLRKFCMFLRKCCTFFFV